jgi:DNA repair protein RAD50
MKTDRLRELQEKKSLSESQLQSCETRMQNIIEELEKKKELMRNADPIRRRLDDNLNYRKTKAKVDKLLSEIEILEESMSKVGVFDTIEKELQKLSKERERLLEEVFSYS